VPSPITAGAAVPGTKYTTRGQELVTAGALVEDAGVQYRRVTTQLGVHSDLPMDYPLYPLDAASSRVGALVGLPEDELRPQLAKLSAEELDELADQDGRTWVLDAVVDLQLPHVAQMRQDEEDEDDALAASTDGDGVHGVVAPPPMADSSPDTCDDKPARLRIAAPVPPDADTVSPAVELDEEDDAGDVCPFTGLPERIMQGAVEAVRTGNLLGDTDTDADDPQQAAGAALVELAALDDDTAEDTGTDGDGAEVVALPQPTRPAPAQATDQDQPPPPPLLPAGMGLCSVCGSQDRIKPKVGDEQVLVLVAHNGSTGGYCMGSGCPPAVDRPPRPAPVDPAGVWDGATTADERLAIVKDCSTVAEVERLRLAPSPTPELQAAVKREFDRQVAGLARVDEALALDGAQAQVARLRDLLTQTRTTARPGVVAYAQRELQRREAAMDPQRATGDALDRLAAAGGWPPRLDGEADDAMRERVLAALRPAAGTPAALEAALEAALAQAGMPHNVTITQGPQPGAVDVLVVGAALAALDLVTDRLDALLPAGVQARVRSDQAVTPTQLVDATDDTRQPIAQLVDPSPAAPPWDLGARPWPERVAMSSLAAALELIREQRDAAMLREAWVQVELADGNTALLEACEERWESLTGDSWDTDPEVPERRQGPGQPLPPAPAPDPEPDDQESEPQRRRGGPTYTATLELDMGDAEARVQAVRKARLASKAQALQQLQTYLQQWPVQALAAQSLGIRMEIRLDNTPPTDLD